MKKFLLVLLALLSILPFTGCSKEIDYTKYISEKRVNMYLYENDGISIKIYCSEREQPYAADGICGNMGDFCEVFISLDKNPEELEVSLCGYGGDIICPLPPRPSPKIALKSP